LLFEFFKKYSFMFLLILNLIMFAFIPIGLSYIFKPPISRESTSILISPPGSVALNFHIYSGDLYNLEFYFHGDGHTDPVSTNGGVPIPVFLEIYSLSDGQYIFQGEIITKGSVGGIKDYAIRHIKSTRLKPGDYKMVMHIIKDVPEFSNFQTQIAMTLSQITFENYYFGSIFARFLLIIIDIIFLLYIVIKGVRNK